MILCFACGIFGDVWILGRKLYSSGSGRNGSGSGRRLCNVSELGFNYRFVA